MFVLVQTATVLKPSHDVCKQVQHTGLTTARDVMDVTSPIETNVKFTSAWQDQ